MSVKLNLLKELKQAKIPYDIKEVEKGIDLFLETNLKGKLAYVLDGYVSIGNYFEGEKIVVDVVGEGEFLTIREVFTNNCNIEFAELLSDVGIVVVFDAEALKEIICENIKLMNNMKDILNKELMIYEELSIKSILRGAEERVVFQMLRMNEKFGFNVGYERKVQIGLNHNVLSRMAQTSRQTVTTLFNKLKNENILYYDRKNWIIRDLDYLKSIVQ